jgi:hypothetical protein
MGVALAATPPLAKKEFRAGLAKVRERLELAQVERQHSFRLFAVWIRHVGMKFFGKPINQCPDRHFYQKGFSIAAMLVLALAMRSTMGTHIWLVIQVRQVVGVNVGFQDDTSSIAAISTVRSAVRNEFLPAKAATAIPAIPSLCMDANVIDELHSAIKAQEAESGKAHGWAPICGRSLLLNQRLV